MDRCPELTKLAINISDRDKTIFRVSETLAVANKKIAELEKRLQEAKGLLRKADDMSRRWLVLVNEAEAFLKACNSERGNQCQT